MKKFNNIIELLEQYSISNLEQDSRKVRVGTAFFALQGQNSDGNNYIEEALSRGASLIISDKISDEARNIFKVKDAQVMLAEVASVFFQVRPKNLLTVTGTNGKSSVVSYIAQILGYLKIPAASIGSLGTRINDNLDLELDFAQNSSLNTQELIPFYKILTELKKRNVDCVAFESSSHGLELRRLMGIKVKAVGFTSFTQDHLDFHGNMKSYLQAKLKIFKDNLAEDGVAIINSDMVEAEEIISYIESLGKKIITVGANGQLKITGIQSWIDRQKIKFEYKAKKYEFQTKVIGSFQAYNLLIALLIVEAGGIDFDKGLTALPFLKAVTGRLERVESDKYIFVDYAHTPDALEKSLEELKKLKETGAKLLVVFGCGGDRDRSKRPIMGNIANKIADIVIVTDDNPRNESASIIRKEIMINAPKAIEIEGRREAIKYAIAQMQKQDILLIAGKGHENYQIIGSQKFNFSDIEIAKELARVK